MVKFINYSGTKIKFIDIINNEINRSTNEIYVEPFLGSGSIFFNLEKKFEQYILNDLDTNIIKMYKAFQNATYSDFKDMEDICTIKYDIKNNKEDFYTFRNNVNKIEDEYYYGLGLFFLCNSTINSMARFGPNGFNSSFGKRFRTLSKNDFDLIVSKLKRAEIYNTDFFNLNIPEENCLLFLDPPYMERPTAYKTITQDFFIKYINYLKETKNDFIYTDIDHEYLKMNKIILRENMYNTAPSSKKEKTKTEIMFLNY